MKAERIYDLNDEQIIAELKKEPGLLSEIESEREEVVSTDDYPITSFKVEQRLINTKIDGYANIGAFVNGESNVKRLKTRYILVFFSDKHKTVDGGSIKRRFGYGFEFTLSVTDIETKLSTNFGALSASNSLGLSRVGYHASVYAAEDLSFLNQLSAVDGQFDYSAYQELSNFIEAAKEHLASADIKKLYPIERVIPSEIELEKTDVESIYFAVKQINDEKTLNEALEKARDVSKRASGVSKIEINENVLQYIYKYFKLRNAYTPPNKSQVQKALNWISGSYNKANETYENDNWISIDVTLDDQGDYVSNLGVPNSSDYQPHPVPDNWHSLPHHTRILKDYVSLESSSNIKLLSTFDAKLNFNSITFIRDVTSFYEVSSGSAGSEVKETRCGIGVRFKIFVSNIEFGTDINFNTIGAASDMGHANVEFQISGIGIPDKEMIKILPGPLDISQDSMAALDKVIDSIETKLSTMDFSELQPQPFAIRVKDSQKVDPTLDAQATVFAIANIKEGLTLSSSIEMGKKLGVSEKIIKKTYAEFGIKDLNELIEGKSLLRGYYGTRAKARDWFRKFN